jgi:hypothetical protein
MEKCLAVGCENVIPEDRAYCSDHMCKREGCYRVVEEKATYCEDACYRKAVQSLSTRWGIPISVSIVTEKETVPIIDCKPE